MIPGRPPDPPPLTIVKLAERWELSIEAARRRVKRIGLPAFNVGPPSEPDWRYRLCTVERWEAENECIPGEAGAPAEVPVKAAAPLAWDGVDPWKTKMGGKSKRRQG